MPIVVLCFPGLTHDLGSLTSPERTHIPAKAEGRSDSETLFRPSFHLIVALTLTHPRFVLAILFFKTRQYVCVYNYTYNLSGILFIGTYKDNKIIIF